MGMFCQENCLNKDLNSKVNEFHLLLHRGFSSRKCLIYHFQSQLLQKVHTTIISVRTISCFIATVALVQIIVIMLDSGRFLKQNFYWFISMGLNLENIWLHGLFMLSGMIQAVSHSKSLSMKCCQLSSTLKQALHARLQKYLMQDIRIWLPR